MSGPWVQTASGGKWDLLHPHPKQVYFWDVAHALSQINRFTGHTCLPFSVAQHSLNVETRVAELTLDPAVRLMALLHDAHEFVLGDWATPLKLALEQILPDFGVVTNQLRTGTDVAIFAAAGLDPTTVLDADAKRLIKQADAEMLMAERKVLMMEPPEPWAAELEALPILRADTSPRPWEQARRAFLSRFQSLQAQVLAGSDPKSVWQEWGFTE